MLVRKVDKMTLTIEEKLETISLPLPHHPQSSLLWGFYSSGFPQMDYIDNDKLLVPPPEWRDLHHPASGATPRPLFTFIRPCCFPSREKETVWWPVVEVGYWMFLFDSGSTPFVQRGQHYPKHLVYELKTQEQGGGWAPLWGSCLWGSFSFWYGQQCWCREGYPHFGHTALINRYLLFLWTFFLFLVDLGSGVALMCWSQGAMNLSAAH